MDPLDDKLFEAKAVLWGMNIYKSVLDFILGFVFFALVLHIAGVSIALAFIPAGLYALVRFFMQARDADVVKRLRGSYGGLNESLQAALEYKHEKNVIVESLVAEVNSQMDAIESSTFLRGSDVSKRVAATIILSFIFLTFVIFDLRSLAYDGVNFLMQDGQLQNTIDDLTGGAHGGMNVTTGDNWEDSNLQNKQDPNKLGANPGGKNPGISEGPMPGKGGGTGGDSKKDIYGDAKSASIAGRDVDFKLHPEYGGDIEVRDTGARTAEKAFAIDQVSSVEECADCVVGPENEEMVRRYFEKILPMT